MSLINKMLQDLDRRHAHKAIDKTLPPSGLPRIPAMGLNAKSALPRGPFILAAGVALILLAGVGMGYWKYGRQQAASAGSATLLAGRTIVAPPPPVSSVAPAAISTAPIDLGAPPATPSNPGQSAQDKPPAHSLENTPADAPAPSPRMAAEKPSAPAAKFKHAALPGEPEAANTSPARSLTEAVSGPPPRPAKNQAFRKPAKTAEGEVVKEISASQRAVFAYQQGLAFLQDGRVTEAYDSLEQSLALDPSHKPARQLLVSLYMQNKQWRQAGSLLHDGLKLDAAQPSLAMTLARIQVELGNNTSALATLKSTLPYAADQAGYLAFLATLYQRQGQHSSAIQYFQQALELTPNHGPWLMGLGISQQADNRMDEARRSFTRALQAGGLPSASKSYVENWLQQHR